LKIGGLHAAVKGALGKDQKQTESPGSGHLIKNLSMPGTRAIPEEKQTADRKGEE
jgi:hypothetical protein